MDHGEQLALGSTQKPHRPLGLSILRRMIVAVVIMCVLVTSGYGQTQSETSAKILADSVRDFSAEQGANSWTYGYWDRTATAGKEYEQAKDFQLLKHFGDDPINGLSQRKEFTTGKLWYLEDGRYFTSLWAEGGHANSSMKLGRHEGVEHWAVRRWVSPVECSAKLTGRVGKVMPWGKNWEGVCRALIVVDGNKVFSAAMDNDGQDYSIEVGLRKGSTIDFLIGPAPTIGVTKFTATIAVVDLAKDPPHSPTHSPTLSQFLPHGDVDNKFERGLEL